MAGSAGDKRGAVAVGGLFGQPKDKKDGSN